MLLILKLAYLWSTCLSADCSVYCHKTTERKSLRAPSLEVVYSETGYKNHGYYIRIHTDLQGGLWCFLLWAVMTPLSAPSVAVLWSIAIPDYVSGRRKAAWKSILWSAGSAVRNATDITTSFLIALYPTSIIYQYRIINNRIYDIVMLLKILRRTCCPL